MRTVLIVAIVAAWITSAGAVETSAGATAAAERARAASDYLEPKKPVIKELRNYQSMVNAVFDAAFAPDVKVRAIVEPSFFREYAVGIKERSGHYYVFGMEPRVQLWGYELLALFKSQAIVAVSADGSGANDDEIAALQARLPKKTSDVRVMRCYSELDPRLARRVIAVWEGMLSELKASDRLGLDGESYQFAFREGARELEGQIWSPEEGSRGALLTDIAYTMKRLCTWGPPWSFFLRARLAREVGDLEKRVGVQRR